MVISGKAIHEIDIGAHPIKSQQAIIIRPGNFHSFHTCRKLNILNCVFLPSVIENELAWLLEEPAVGQMLYHPMNTKQLGSTVINCSRKHAQRCLDSIKPIISSSQSAHMPVSRSNAINRVATVISELAEQWAGQHDLSEECISPVVYRTMQRLTEQPEHPWQMDALADQVHCSKAYLTRLFSAAMGISPMAYLAQVRAEQAAILLRRTLEPVSHIAERTGYPNAEHFSRRFRDHFLMTPSAYRRRHQKYPTY